MPEAAPVARASTEAPAGGELRAVGLAGVGTALPERTVTSAEVGDRLRLKPDWIEQRTGIRERRVASGSESVTALAIEAGENALAASGVTAPEIDLVLVATVAADRLLPNAAPLVAGGLGCHRAFACDIGAACTGFLSGLALGAAQVESGRIENALVIGAEVLSRVTDHEDRKTAGLFADGAGAAVLSSGGAGSIGRIILRSDATEAECIVLSHEERVIRMRGQDTFRAAVDALSDITLEVLTADGAGTEDIDLFVYHQANARITRAVGERLGLPADRVVDCIGRLGNTSAATLPLALAHAAREGRLKQGDRVLLAAFGAGFVWGGGLITWAGEVSP